MPKKQYIKNPITGKEIPVQDVIIIGGGIAGLSAARRLAEAGKSSAVFEQRKGFMQGASGINPGRMGLGFHYADLPTAFTYLKATIEFVKKYKKEGYDFRLGSDKYTEDDPMRRGRYFIPDNSLVPAEKLIRVYEAIQAEYKRLCNEDSSNEVFGNPELFYRILSPKEYKKDVSSDQDIALAIETREQLLDVPRFSNYLISQVEGNENISTHLNAHVTSIEKTPDSAYYIVTYEQNGQIKQFAAPQLINASWESTDRLNKTMGIHMEPAGYDLVLMSESAYMPLSAEKLAAISKEFANEKGPVPIVVKNSNGDIRIYGNTSGSNWEVTQLNKRAFQHVKFPENTIDTFVFKNGTVPISVREEIAGTYNPDEEIGDRVKTSGIVPSTVTPPRAATHRAAHIPASFRVNRTKILAEVELPPELQDKPCMFFAIGPFCMFSNMQNGRGLMTYAPETNYSQTNELALTKEEEAKLHTGFNDEETQRIGAKVIAGVAKYIPEMAKAKLIGIRGGVVKTYGDVDICDPNSDFHKRRELGIQEMAIDALEISSMKLLYGEENAIQAVQLLEIFDEVKQEITKMAERLALHYVKVPLTPRTKQNYEDSEISTEMSSAGTSPNESYWSNLLVDLAKRGIHEQDQISVLIKERISQNQMETSQVGNGHLMSNVSSSSSASSSVHSLTSVEQQNCASVKILTNHFAVYLKNHSSTKDINEEASKKALLSGIRKTIDRKLKLTEEIIGSSVSHNDTLVPSKIKKNI